MTILRYLRVLILSLYWQLPKAKEIDLVIRPEVSKEQRRKVDKRKRIKKEHHKLPPVQRRTFYHQRFSSTKPKDHRFSDQRKLRRMYRGV